MGHRTPGVLGVESSLTAAVEGGGTALVGLAQRSIRGIPVRELPVPADPSSARTRSAVRVAASSGETVGREDGRMRMDRAERLCLYKIEQFIRSRGHVSMKVLMEDLGASRATLTRDLDYLRDRIYDPLPNGYVFKADKRDSRQKSLPVPGAWFSEEELQVLLTMHQLISELDDAGVLAPSRGAAARQGDRHARHASRCRVSFSSDWRRAGGVASGPEVAVAGGWAAQDKGAVKRSDPSCHGHHEAMREMSATRTMSPPLMKNA